MRKFSKSYVLDKINRRQLQAVQGEMSSEQQDTGTGSLERPLVITRMEMTFKAEVMQEIT